MSPSCRLDNPCRSPQTMSATSASSTSATPISESLREIVDTALIVLASRSQTYFPQLGGEAAHVTILDPATITEAPPALVSRLAPLIRLGIALLIGLALAFFAEYVDPTIYHQDDLRRMGLPLLGSVPSERT